MLQLCHTELVTRAFSKGLTVNYPDGVNTTTMVDNGLPTPVRQRFEVDGRGGNSLPRALFLGVCVESVGQVTARGEVETHNSVVRLE